MGHSAHRGGVLHAGDKDTVDRIDAVFPLLLFLPLSFTPSPSIIRSSRGLEMPFAEGVYTLL